MNLQVQPWHSCLEFGPSADAFMCPCRARLRRCEFFLRGPSGCQSSDRRRQTRVSAKPCRRRARPSPAKPRRRRPRRRARGLSMIRSGPGLRVRLRPARRCPGQRQRRKVAEDGPAQPDHGLCVGPLQQPSSRRVQEVLPNPAYQQAVREEVLSDTGLVHGGCAFVQAKSAYESRYHKAEMLGFTPSLNPKPQTP